MKLNKILLVITILLISLVSAMGNDLSNKTNSISAENLKAISPSESIDVIVVFKNEINETILENSGAKIKESLDSIAASIITANKESIKEIRNNSNVEVVELDINLELFGDGSSASLDSQIVPWGIEKINAPKAWNESTGKRIKIAIIDSGINKNHPDLKERVVGGISFINNTEYWNDESGHGTSVAGVIGATDNIFGVVGVAPESELYSVKVIGASGGKLSNFIQGLQWAIDNDIDIIVMSLGIPVDSPSLHKIVDEGHSNGIILVAASGKDGQIYYPAKYSSVIAVGSINENNELTSENGAGEELELVAPGADIISTSANGYASFDGTSMAVPHVAGVIALLKENNPLLSNNEIRAKLQRDAFDLGSSGKDNYFGYGLVSVNLKTETLNATMQIVFSDGLNKTNFVKVELIKVEEKSERVVHTLFYNSNNKIENVFVEPGIYKVKQYYENDIYEGSYNVSEGDLVVVPLYVNTQQKDFVIDAPWRIEPGKSIPLLLLIHDANLNNYPLDKIEVKDSLANIVRYTYDYSGDSCGSDNTRIIKEHLWYELKSLNPNIFLKDTNNTIHLQITMFVSNGCFAGSFDGDVIEELTVKVDNRKYPKLKNWYCGDTHYHSIYTDTSFAGVYGEIGAPVDATEETLNAMGIDWITITDHSNSLTINKNWGSFISDCNISNKCLIGEEINCDYSSGSNQRNHYLGYKLLSVKEDTNPGSILSFGIPTTKSCSEVISEVKSEGGFGYLAHPTDSLLNGLAFGKLTNYSLPFTGLEVWNEAIENVGNLPKLEEGLKNWTNLLLKGRKVFISAGSDAHGDFNSKTNYLTGEKSFTGLGRALTCCYTPSYSKSNVFNALKNGNCFMGNNGALKFEITTPDTIGILGSNISGIIGDSATFKIDYNLSEGCRLKLYEGILGNNGENVIKDWGIVSGESSKIFTATWGLGDPYYRVECINGTDRIYTNPIWVNVSEPVCNDEIQNGDELGIDCGGSCITQNQEVCNNQDDNKNCLIDENIQRECSENYLGVCAIGMETCINGNWNGCLLPQIEICDSQDNSCNGDIDEVIECLEIPIIHDPKEGEILNDRKILINVSTNKDVKYIKYQVDGRISRNREPIYSTLCSNCSNIEKSIIFLDGNHTLGIVTINQDNRQSEDSVSFFVDSKDPTISRTEPTKNKINNGKFDIDFSEDNPSGLILYNSNNITTIIYPVDIENNCILDRNRYKCHKEVNLGYFDGQKIEYWFRLQDVAGNVDTSKEIMIEADTTKPELNSFNYSIDGKRVEFLFNITEKNFYKVNYIDRKDSKPKEKAICLRLKNGICKIKKSFIPGEHNLTISILDEAGNLIQRQIEFMI